MPGAVAAILVVPAATPVVSPVLLIVAVAVLLLDHVKLALFTALPLESFAVAVNCAVPATVTEGDVGETITLAMEMGAGLLPPPPLNATATTTRNRRRDENNPPQNKRPSHHRTPFGF